MDGDINGRSEDELLMVYVAGRPAAYCGFEWVTVTPAGRTGSFVLHHNASAGLAGRLSLTVVPGSGAGQWQGWTARRVSRSPGRWATSRQRTG